MAGLPQWIAQLAVRQAADYEQSLTKVRKICQHEGSNLELVLAEVRRRHQEAGMTAKNAADSVYDDLASARWMP